MLNRFEYHDCRRNIRKAFREWREMPIVMFWRNKADGGRWLYVNCDEDDLACSEQGGYRPGDARRVWTEDEIAILREWYPEHGAAKVAELTGRSYNSVGAKGHLLGIKCSKECLRRLRQTNLWKLK